MRTRTILGALVFTCSGPWTPKPPPPQIVHLRVHVPLVLEFLPGDIVPGSKDADGSFCSFTRRAVQVDKEVVVDTPDSDTDAMRCYGKPSGAVRIEPELMFYSLTGIGVAAESLPLTDL